MLIIKVPQTELFDPKTETFNYLPETILKLEHSLISISKWESRWHKAYLKKDPNRTVAETLDYVRCMALTPVDLQTVSRLGPKDFETIQAYINEQSTATTVKHIGGPKNSNQMVTSELIYAWMTELRIPWEAQKWHLSRLMTLIDVMNERQKPQKKMSRAQTAKQNTAINAARRARYNTRG